MINLDHLRQILDGNEDMAQHFILLFRSEMPKQLDALERFIHTADRESAHIMAHAIKGQVRYLGREDLAALAQALEKSIETRELYEQVWKAWTQMREPMWQLLKDLEQAAPPQQT